MLDNIKREPAIIGTLVSNVIALAVAFGLKLSMDQTAAIMAVVTTLTAIFFIRPNVTPNMSVVAREDKGEAVAADASPLPNGTSVVVLDDPTKAP